MTATTPFDEMNNADGSVREPYLILRGVAEGTAAAGAEPDVG